MEANEHFEFGCCWRNLFYVGFPIACYFHGFASDASILVGQLVEKVQIDSFFFSGNSGTDFENCFPRFVRVTQHLKENTSSLHVRP